MGASLGVWLFIVGAAGLFGWWLSMVVQALAAWLAVRDPLSARSYEKEGDS